ncbi:MAG: peptidoglycan DD-metalloendopeptidase family protein [Treponema sp.]|nr:peptidoglycan DD-metalloendopeptidase family protein [Treponema sp.]
MLLESSESKHPGIFFLCIFILFPASAPEVFAEQLVTAAHAQTLPHDTPLALRGNIIFGLGTDRYLFRDSSGDMVLKIEEELWNGVNIGQFDRVEVTGDLKKDDRNWTMELDVKSIGRPGTALERGARELEYLFIWPVIGRVSSPFGNRRSPLTGRQQFHTGIDIVAPMGSPVWAAMSGRVSIVSRDNIYGNYIMIIHHSGLRTLYAHLSATGVSAGAYVATGQQIGNVGSTGLSTGPHLHFGVFRNGMLINPRELLR